MSKKITRFTERVITFRYTHVPVKVYGTPERFIMD